MLKYSKNSTKIIERNDRSRGNLEEIKYGTYK